jgi:hypothetical protein
LRTLPALLPEAAFEEDAPADPELPRDAPAEADSVGE